MNYDERLGNLMAIESEAAAIGAHQPSYGISAALELIEALAQEQQILLRELRGDWAPITSPSERQPQETTMTIESKLAALSAEELTQPTQAPPDAYMVTDDGVEALDVDALMTMLFGPSLILTISEKNKAGAAEAFAENKAAFESNPEDYHTVTVSSVVAGFSAALAQAVDDKHITFEVADAINHAAALMSAELVTPAEGAGV